MPLTRRRFLSDSTAAAAGAGAASLLPTAVRTRAQGVSPSDKLVVRRHRLQRDGLLQPALAAADGRGGVRCALRRRRRCTGAAQARRGGDDVGHPEAVRRLPGSAGEPRPGRGGHRHAGPLALPADGRGVRGGQGRLLREAAGQLHRGKLRHGRGRETLRPDRADRTVAAQRPALGRGDRLRPLGQAGTHPDRAGLGLHELAAAGPQRPRRAGARRRRPTTCGSARRRSGRSTATASTSIFAGTGTTPAA